jgi:hypothetical protein
LIEDISIFGAIVSATGCTGADHRDNVTGIVTLLEKPAKSKATRSKVYSLFLKPVHVIVTCLVSLMLFVSPCGYSKIQTCCLLRRTKILLIFLGPLTVYEIVKGDQIVALAVGVLIYILILVSGFSSLP